MSTEIKEAAVEAPQAIMMPETPEHLKVFVAATLTDLLNIPENATHFARVVLSAGLKALNNEAQHKAQLAMRPVLTRTPYAGCLRAVITANEVASDEPLTVDITIREVGSEEWVDSKIPAHALQELAKLVLSQATVPGDVWYITTNQAVDQQLDKAAEALLNQAQADADPV
ncbi:hypothetical protein D3C85_429260 [compost metagenome]